MDKLGEIKYNNFGSKMEIIRFKNKSDIDIYFPQYDWIAEHRYYNDFQKGSIKCPFEPTVYGVGFYGVGKYKSRENGIKTNAYKEWHNMFARCYGNYKKRNITYDDCIVCEEWHNFQNFAEWYEENYYEIEGEKICLDKDILYKGNKIYSPQTCIFVPQRINILFIKSDKIRGDYPIGVVYNKRDDVFESWINKCSNDNKKKQIYLGRYNTSEEAFRVYKIEKEKYIKQIADECKSYIPKKLYDAMYRYEVEIDD